MSRRVYLLGVGLALVAVALAFTDWALGPRPGVTEVNVRRIRPGMTLAEVEALFGVAGNYYESPRLKEAPPGLPKVDPRMWRVWMGEGGLASVTFDDNGKVAESRFFRHSSTTTPLARFRAWLGW